MVRKLRGIKEGIGLFLPSIHSNSSQFSCHQIRSKMMTWRPWDTLSSKDGRCRVGIGVYEMCILVLSILGFGC
jgi:hypothetical protein